MWLLIFHLEIIQPVVLHMQANAQPQPREVSCTEAWRPPTLSRVDKLLKCLCFPARFRSLDEKQKVSRIREK